MFRFFSCHLAHNLIKSLKTSLCYDSTALSPAFLNKRISFLHQKLRWNLQVVLINWPLLRFFKCVSVTATLISALLHSFYHQWTSICVCVCVCSNMCLRLFLNLPCHCLREMLCPAVAAALPAFPLPLTFPLLHRWWQPDSAFPSVTGTIFFLCGHTLCGNVRRQQHSLTRCSVHTVYRLAASMFPLFLSLSLSAFSYPPCLLSAAAAAKASMRRESYGHWPPTPSPRLISSSPNCSYKSVISTLVSASKRRLDHRFLELSFHFHWLTSVRRILSSSTDHHR